MAKNVSKMNKQELTDYYAALIAEIDPEEYVDPEELKTNKEFREAIYELEEMLPEEEQKEAPAPKVKVGDLCIAKLQEVKETNEDGLEIGFTFAEIVDFVRSQLPSAKTTSASVNWYATQLRKQNIKMPWRAKQRKVKK